MTKKRNNFINGLLLEKPVYIPKEYKEELSQEVLRINISREKMIAYVLIAISIATILLNIIAAKLLKTQDEVFLGLTLSHVVLFLGPVFFLFLKYLDDRKLIKYPKIVNVIHIYICILVLAICSLIIAKIELISLSPFAYIMANVSIVSLILLAPKERRIVFITPYIFDVIEVILTEIDLSVVLEEIFFFTFITILSMIVSRVNYNLYSNNFISNKMVIKKNEEIDKLYNTTKDLLNERTKELNEAKEYEKVRTAFFANISHELRTPLNIIFSAEQMLDILVKEGKKIEDGSQIDEYMGMIKQNCYRLIRLINNLIDITKIDAGYFAVNLVNCDIVKVVEDIVGSVVKYIEDRNICITFDTEIEEQVMACDPDNIERIILNLLSNAIKFTPEGGEIKVYVYQCNGTIFISVLDTGIGIPMEMRELIFERFVQVDKTTTRSREGSGIGLSIVKSLVELQGGDIILNTDPGEGSEFIVSLPVRLIENEEFISGSNMIGFNETVENINIEFSDIY